MIVTNRGTRVVGALAGCAALLLAVGIDTAAAALPDGRRYELVTPVQKNAADVLPQPERTRAAADGGAVQYASLTGFADVRGGGVAAEYLAIRDPLRGVWRTHAITPTQEPLGFIPDVGAGFESQYVGEFSSDLSHGVFTAKTPLTSAPNVAHVVNFYLRSDLLTPGAGSYQLLSDAISDQGSVYDPEIRPRLAGASADFSHVLFESPRSLVAQTASLDLSALKLYEWVNGTLRFVGMIPPAPATTCGGGGPGCVPAAISQAGRGASVETAYTNGTISQDGRRVLLTVPDPTEPHAGQLYLRDDQGTPTLSDDLTVQVTASERSMPDTPRSATFWAASNDGTKIFFTTAEKLTDEDPNSSSDLYRFDLSAPAGARLTRISIDTEPGDNQGNDLANGHAVAGAIGASNDGETVYFAVAGSDGTQLIAGGPTALPVGNGGAGGNARIYRWHAGTLHEVGGINNTIELERILGKPGWAKAYGTKWSRVSPDGRHLAFITQGTDQLLSRYGKPEYDHGNTGGTGVSISHASVEVYVYDAEASNGTGDLQCASCNPTGTPAQGDALFFTTFAFGVTKDSSHLSHQLSDDGHYVFFDSSDRLVPADKNSTLDTYEFDTTTGQVHLLSSGTSTTRSIFLDASADGSDVFFVTRSQLRSEDHDQSNDLYDARINGAPDPGISLSPACEGEDCRPAVIPTATAKNPASIGFVGAHDQLGSSNPARFFHAQPLTARQRHRLATSGHARLTISTSAPGTIVVRVRARIRGHVRTIHTIRRTLRHGATIDPTIRLNGAARRQLSAHHRLRLTIVVSYSQASAPQRLLVKLRDG